jgi:hypothetical protein
MERGSVSLFLGVQPEVRAGRDGLITRLTTTTRCSSSPSCIASPPIAGATDPLHPCHSQHQQQVKVLLPPAPIASLPPRASISTRFLHCQMPAASHQRGLPPLACARSSRPTTPNAPLHSRVRARPDRPHPRIARE